MRLRWPSTQAIGIGLLVILLAWMVLAPVGMTVWGSFRTAPPGMPGGYTLANYARAYGNSALGKSIWNTAVFSVGAALVSFIIGAFLAWVTERTNTPLRPVIYALVMFPMIVPTVLQGISWILLFNPTMGMVNKLATLWFGVEGPIMNGYTMTGMIWMQGLSYISLPFLMMAAAFRTMDPSMEEASMASGASMWTMMRTVTLPLLTPAVFSTMMLLLLRNIESFEVPALAGIPGGVPVFATQVWLAVRGTPPNYNVGAAFGVGYLVVTLVAVYLYHRSTSLADRFVTVTGKGYRPSRLDLGAWRWPMAGFSLLALTVSVVLPMLVIIWTSLMPYYMVVSWRALARITLDNYKTVLAMQQTYTTLSNSLVVGIGASVGAIFLAAVISWIVLRTRIRGRHLLDMLSFAPIALPGMVMGLSLLWLYLTAPIPIYGTLWILGLAFISKYITYGVRATHTALIQVHPELEEASQACGAPWRSTFFRVLLPLIAPGMTVGFIYILSLTFKVLSLPLLLTHTNSRLMAIMIFDLYDGGYYTRLAALGVLMLVVLLILSGVSRKISGRFGVEET